MPLQEPTVALTDLALAIEAGAFAIALRRERPESAPTRAMEIQGGLVRSFGWSAVAALAGAALHGLTERRDDPNREVLWRTSLASIGLASLGTCLSSVALGLPPGARRRLRLPITAAHGAYVVLVTATHREFPVAVTVAVPAASSMALALVARWGSPTSADPRCWAWPHPG